MSCSCYFFPPPQKNTGWPWRGEVWGNSFLWSVCMSVFVFHWAIFLHLRSTDVRFYHCYTLNRLQTAAVSQRELTNCLKQQPKAPRDSTTASCPVSTINNVCSVAGCTTEDFKSLCVSVLSKELFQLQRQPYLKKFQTQKCVTRSIKYK